MSAAILFPGQGSQAPGMRELVASEAPDLLERCLALVGEDPFERVAESTRYAQPAIFCASIANWRRLSREGDAPIATAGHSLGEISALTAAGAVAEEDALRLVVLRGRLMSEAVGGAMLALLGVDDDRAVALAEAHGVHVANFNAPGQVVLSGRAIPLAAAGAEACAEGVRTLDLDVTGAFHSPSVLPAVGPFAEALRGTSWRAPAFPVISCASAAPMTHPARELAETLTAPVRWTATMRALAALGADEFIDVGPGRILAKLARRTLETSNA